MNLFCFSLEGSMDSLYEPVPEHQEPKDTTTTDSQVSTPASPPLNCGPPDRSKSLEFPDFENTVTKKRKSIQKSMSENEAFDRKNVNGTLWQGSRKPENDSYIRRHCQLEEDNIIADGIHLLQGKKIEETTCQVINYEQWIPPRVHNPGVPGNSEMGTEPEDKVESMGTLKRLQKLVRTKKTSTQSLEDVKHVLLPLNALEDAYLSEEDEEALTSCMKLTRPQEKKTWKDSSRRKEEKTEFHLWSDWKMFPDNQLCPCDFLISKIEEWENCTCSSHQPHLTYSLTDMDLQYSWRTSSFGSFDRFRHHSISKTDDSAEISELETISDIGETVQTKAVNNGGSLSKKMRAISLTMKRKMGKKYIKALSEEMNEEGKDDSDPGGGIHTEKVSLKTSDSLESLYSLNSGQSSSSGVTSCSDGTSNRDSLRFDDEVPYSGPFCGRAKVHTDFTPSPYDTDSLKIKKGDIIDIICKTPMGIWTGMLNNKVGNFKFIYVDIILEEEAAPRKINQHRGSKRTKPKTLQELLECVHLQEYASTLLLNGYETLEDLKDLQESHLIELNISNPEDRARLLSAIENLQDCDIEQQQKSEDGQETQNLNPCPNSDKSQLNDCPRDSGCYISSENSDNGKEEVDPEALSDMVQSITITESN
ncbi:SAM domain-containing protein SAMSN-1-like isoform X2 [Neopelma chrysocephalum]|uniref:SAM domain-containing protein SAMSN-1-like isoform X2 n=1 Tax=Neopelma chrysocephalum TaxID=114329 RepID=UPI000FCD07C2|nr:SAM domain-containing protein SAMSN-1-like isoform X2 [Neopelma chrysocephalum]